MSGSQIWVNVDQLELGVDISTVQAMAGHQQVQTTVRYDRRGEQTKAHGAQRLHVPYLWPLLAWPAPSDDL